MLRSHGAEAAGPPPVGPQPPGRAHRPPRCSARVRAGATVAGCALLVLERAELQAALVGLAPRVQDYTVAAPAGEPERPKTRLRDLALGQKLWGRVVSVAPSGAFVDVGAEVAGLVLTPRSVRRWAGQKMYVAVSHIEDGALSLSMLKAEAQESRGLPAVQDPPAQGEATPQPPSFWTRVQDWLRRLLVAWQAPKAAETCRSPALGINAPLNVSWRPQAVAGQDAVAAPAASGTAIIVEPRRHSKLEPVMRRFMTRLPDWNFVLYHGAENGDFCRAILPRLPKLARLVDLGIPAHMSGACYSQILTSHEFWQGYVPHSSEYVLIFQTDAWLCDTADRSIGDFFHHTAIGAGIGIFGNGGLSLRKLSAMLAVTAVFRPTSESEDVVFDHRLIALKYKPPRQRDRDLFATEGSSDTRDFRPEESGETRPWGCHKLGCLEYEGCGYPFENVSA